MKPLLIFINAFLLIFIAYFCVQIFYKQIEKRFFILDETPRTKNLNPVKIQSAGTDSFKNQSEKILARNLFKAGLEEKKDRQKNQPVLMDDIKNLKPTDLELTLWGTVIGTTHTYAVIEDKKTKVQALYQTKDKVQEAVIKKVLRDRVILTYNNQDYILETDMKQLPDTFEEAPKESLVTPREIIVKKSLIASSLKNIDGLKRQIRIKPLMNQGRPDGLLVYSIKPDSFFHTLGLQNGDVLRKVNERPTTSFEDALKIYQDLGDADKVTVSILRKGKLQELEYHIASDENEN